MSLVLRLFFFFSSRRRHTRWTGDWSSDVCSSDLGRDGGGTGAPPVCYSRAGLGRIGSGLAGPRMRRRDRKSTRLNSSHPSISYAVFCLKKKTDAINIGSTVPRILAGKAPVATRPLGPMCAQSLFFFLLERRPPSSTLFPYTTLFRSRP